jgi:hypothetical protein
MYFREYFLSKYCIVIQTAEYVRFRRDLGGGKLKKLGAGAQKCLRGGLRGGQPPKGQSLLKQEENGLICFTSFLFSSQVNSGATVA